MVIACNPVALAQLYVDTLAFFQGLLAAGYGNGELWRGRQGHGCAALERVAGSHRSGDGVR